MNHRLLSSQSRPLEDRGLTRVRHQHLMPLDRIAQVRIRLDQRHHLVHSAIGHATLSQPAPEELLCLPTSIEGTRWPCRTQGVSGHESPDDKRVATRRGFAPRGAAARLFAHQGRRGHRPRLQRNLPAVAGRVEAGANRTREALRDHLPSFGRNVPALFQALEDGPRARG